MLAIAAATDAATYLDLFGILPKPLDRAEAFARAPPGF